MDAGQSMDDICVRCSLLFLSMAIAGCDVTVTSKYPHHEEKRHKNGNICICPRHHTLYTSGSDIRIIGYSNSTIKRHTITDSIPCNNL